MKRPKPISEPPLRAYAHRPPLDSDPARWAWRVVHHVGSTQRAVRGAGGRYTRREMKRRLLDLVDAGDWHTPAAPDGDRVLRTVGDLLEAWFDAQTARADRGTITPATLRRQRQARDGLTAALGDLRLLELDRDDLQEWVDRSTLSPRTLYTRHSNLRSAWRWAQEEGLPLPVLPRPELPTVRRDEHILNHATPTPEQATAIVAQLRAGWPRVAGEILIGTGARIGEVAALTWGDYRSGSLWVVQKASRGKSKRRGLVLTRHLQGVLDAWRAQQPRPPLDSDHLLGVRPATALHLTWMMPEVSEKLGVPGVTPHGMRRMVSTRLISAGIAPQVYEAQMGHLYSEALRVYAQTSTADLAAVAGLLEPVKPTGAVYEFKKEQA